MAEQHWIPANYHSSEWAAVLQEKYSSVNFPLDAPDEARFLRSPPSSPPQSDWSPPNGCTSKKHQEVDQLCFRLTGTGLIGADLAVTYLREKYRKNNSIFTIKQAAYVVLSFLQFLDKTGANLFSVTRQDICAFVEHGQDRGLKANSVICNLRSVYTFLIFLVERKILPLAVLSKKIRLKPPDSLPRAIPSEHVDLLLSATGNPRNHALILLLLRTGLRIGELLNVKISDIVLPERKILIYLAEKNDQGRVVYFSSDADSALREWLKRRDLQKDYLFYSPRSEKISYAAARKAFVQILKRAELSHYGYSLHCLRHTFATDMLNAGLRIEVLQQILGHQSIEMTLRYARLSDATRENEYLRAMTVIEKGGQNASHRISTQLQAVFEEKKLFTSHRKKLSA